MSPSTNSSLAVEIDRTLKLSLSNGQFNLLVEYLNKQKDSQQAAKDLMKKSRTEVLLLVNSLKEK